MLLLLLYNGEIPKTLTAQVTFSVNTYIPIYIYLLGKIYLFNVPRR